MAKHALKRKLRAGHILSALFLFYIFYVGLAALPQLLVNTSETLRNGKLNSSYIKKVNDQYEGMLGTESWYPLLQNKGTYINFNGLMAKKLGQPLMNERITLKNGHLFYVDSKTPDPEEILHAADNIIRFHDAHTASGGNFLFVMVPSQISKYEDLLPAGYTDTTNDTADAFLSLLEQAGVPYLDLREEMHKDGLTVTDDYYSTDHHWKPQTGFWAYTKILKKLEQMEVIDPVDSFYTDPENYVFETYEKTFLGSCGRRTGIYYGGLDDAIFIRPDFETSISISIPARPLTLQGRYEEVAYNTDAVHNYEDPDYYQENCYGLYGWGDTEITHWRNTQAPVQEKFLLIGESFGNIPFSLMSICCSSCDELDPRHFKNDFTDYYNSYRPDTVIVELNIYATLSEITEYEYLE